MSMAIRSRDLWPRFAGTVGVFTAAFRKMASRTRNPVARFAAMIAGDLTRKPYTSHNITPVQKTTSIGYERSLPPCRRIFSTWGTKENVVRAAAAKPKPLISDEETMPLQYSCGDRIVPGRSIPSRNRPSPQRPCSSSQALPIIWNRNSPSAVPFTETYV